MTEDKKPEAKEAVAAAAAAAPAAPTEGVLPDPDDFETGDAGIEAVAGDVIPDPDSFDTGTEGARLGPQEVPPDDLIEDPDDFAIEPTGDAAAEDGPLADPDDFATQAEVTRPGTVAAAPAEAVAGDVIADPDDFVADVNDLSGMDNVIEALLLASETPLSTDSLLRLIGEDFNAGKAELRASLKRLSERYAFTAMQLHEVAGGWRIQVQQDYAHWVARLYHEKPPKLSRATLETLALIVYRQPITRGEIESVRGVAVSSNILRTLLERGWIREVGHKEAPGRPALFGTTAQFLDDFNLRSLDQLPTLPEIKDADQLEAALARLAPQAAASAEAGDEDDQDEPAVTTLSGGENAGSEESPQDATIH